MRRWLLRGLAALAALIMIAGALAYTPDTDAAAMNAKYMTAASRFVAVKPGLSVHVRDEGPREAMPVVLVHGLNASLHTWEPLIARLKDRYRFITIDMPGHGLTGPHPERRYHIPAQLEVVEAVARAKQLQRFVLGGNSMGGAIAWNYALVRPQQLAGIVLINSAGAPRDQISEGDQWENRNVQSPAQASGRQPLGFRIAATPFVRDVVAEMTPRWVVERSLRESIMVQESATDAVIDRYWELLRFPGNRQATIDRFASPRPPSRVGRMGEITVPTLILWGADDPLFPQPLGEAFARAIDGSRLILYPRIGHIPQEEAPDAVATDLSAFLDALPR